MSFRATFCLALDKYKSGDWDREKAVGFLEDYFVKHLPDKLPKSPLQRKAVLNMTEDNELMEVLDDWLVKGKYNDLR